MCHGLPLLCVCGEGCWRYKHSLTDLIHFFVCLFFQEHESCITPWYILHEINASAGSALHTTKPSPWLWTHGSTVMTRLSSHSPCVGDCILKTSDLRSQTWSCLQWWRCADLILGLSFSHGLLPESVSCACSLVSSYACHL